MEDIPYQNLMNMELQRKGKELQTSLDIQKQLEKILDFMKVDYSIRSIERKLDFFYYPLKDYLDISWTTDQSERDIEKIAHYISFATETTEKQFDTFRDTKDLHNEESQKSHDLLLESVINDIKYLEKSLISFIQKKP